MIGLLDKYQNVFTAKQQIQLPQPEREDTECFAVQEQNTEDEEFPKFKSKSKAT